MSRFSTFGARVVILAELAPFIRYRQPSHNISGVGRLRPFAPTLVSALENLITKVIRHPHSVRQRDGNRRSAVA